MTLTATEGNADHGHHVPKPPRDCERITWLQVTQAEDRRRVLRWTCRCRSVVYYLVTAGGRGYIERTVDSEATVQTHRMSYSDVATLWERILLGQAR